MNKRVYILCCIIALLVKTPLFAQESNCTNLGFELGNFNNWTGYSWIYSIVSTNRNTTPRLGIIYRRQTIISDTTAYDANTGYALKKVPSGYNFSACLGDGFISSDRGLGYRCWHQSLRYTMTIDSSNALLIMKFACVLEYASDHYDIIEPRFRVLLYDQNGNIIPDCSNYDVYSSNNNVDGWQTFILSDSKHTPVQWRDWTTVGANLMAYYGQTITVEFMSADCERNLHFGYAYFVAACHPLYITVKYCGDDSIAILTAPEGFEKYDWTNSSGTIINSQQNLKLINPGNETFTCTMTSATGCVVSLQSTINKYIPKANFNSIMLGCDLNLVKFTNLSTKTIGSLQYKWHFDDGEISTEKNPQHKFATSGLHPTVLTLKNPPSTCTDTLIKIVESFSSPLIGISGDSTYCPGESVTLKAYGAAKYIWNNGSDKDHIVVSSPGGTFWVVGSSSNGICFSTAQKKIMEEPDWDFHAMGDTTLCKGQSTILMTSVANRYSWDNGDTTRTRTVSAPNQYAVAGYNKRGCKKSTTFKVSEYPIPNANFTTSTNTLDRNHDQITCTIQPETNVQYVWNMGDSTIITGSTVLHSYTISNKILQYTITQTSTSIYNCIDSVSKIIDVTPFIPNVFSPNEDGINDIFMPNFDLTIFDRNGLMLYQGKEGWNGNYKQRPVDPDTYFYSISYQDRTEKMHIKKGYITLVR
jgi:gliding motility-associated-like protein